MLPLTLPRAVIFDWDNTLVNSWDAIAESINYVRARYGQPVWSMPEIIARCTRSARESFPDWFGAKAQEALDDYYAYFEKARARIGIHPTTGAHDLLEWLREHNIPAIVVSNKKGHYLRQESRVLGWDKYFVAMVGAADATRDKPDREHADHALRLAGLEARPDIWFVGDSEADIVCATNSTLLPVLVGTSEFAAKLGVEVHVDDCSALLKLLKTAATKRTGKGNVSG